MMNSDTNTALRLLHIDSSSRYHDSSTRALGKNFIDQIQQSQAVIHTHRDVAQGLPFIDETWIGANFTPIDQRSPDQHAALSLSDQLIEELKSNDLIVIAVPIYNFTIPASLKAWIDLVARAGVTFRYSENGPVGLLENKKAIVILASGGTKVGSDIDFASGYLKHVLGFIGIHEVEIIAAERLNSGPDIALAVAQNHIEKVANNFIRYNTAEVRSNLG